MAGSVEGYMQMKWIVAIILAGIGIVILAYAGISFSTPGQPVEFLGMRIGTTENHFIPPWVGALLVVAGLAVAFIPFKRGAA